MSFRDFKGVMRPGQKNRPRRNGGGGGNPNQGGGGHQHRGGGQRGPHRQQTFDSSGPGVKIRGNAYQVFERYIALAREAASSGDRIAAENLYQHAEHYFRIMNANGEGYGHAPRPTTPADTEMGMDAPEQQHSGERQQGQAQVEHAQQPQQPDMGESTTHPGDQPQPDIPAGGPLP